MTVTEFPLEVCVWFHHQSAQSTALATELYRALNGPSADWGPRIPVRFCERSDDGGPPPEFLHGGALRSLLVILIDGRMARATDSAERAIRDAWGEIVVDFLRKYPPGGRPHAVLPVAVDAGAFNLSADLSDRSFVRLDHLSPEVGRRELIFQVAIRATRLLQDMPASDQPAVHPLPTPKIELFLSHAKVDLPQSVDQLSSGPLAVLNSRLSLLPVERWIDAGEIPAGGRFADEIAKGILRSSVIVILLTDAYSSREWCRRELLDAKAAGRPIVVVDAVRSRVVRLFPYIGNTPMVRWRSAIANALGATKPALGLRKQHEWEREDADSVLEVTLLEALRYHHDLARLKSEIGPTDAVFGTHPEALTLLNLPSSTTRVLYPDPPLGKEELSRLNQAQPQVQFATPLESLIAWTRPQGSNIVACSLSGASDIDRYGGSADHLATMAHDIALYLLLAGARLLYGGVLGGGATGPGGKAPGDQINYVERLFDLVGRYSELAEQVAGHGLYPIQNWMAWPYYLKLSESERDLYNEHAGVLERREPPDDLALRLALLDPLATERSPQDAGFLRYATARSLTQLREDSTDACHARVAIGGKLDNYSGLLPGVLEEALITMLRRKPLYLMGGFGGAAALTLDLLRGGGERVELSTSWCTEHVDGWAELVETFHSDRRSVLSPEQVTTQIAKLGENGLSSVLRNGLNEEENAELSRTTDAWVAVRLILSGLRRLDQPAG